MEKRSRGNKPRTKEGTMESMERKPRMSQADRQLWDRLTEWSVCRIAGYLNRMEEEQGRGWNRSGEFNESILSLEVHEFFQKSGGKPFLASLPDIQGGEGLAGIQKRLRLDEFELFCVILVMLSELDYHFEKLFVYLNNDWNQRLLSVEWAIRLYTMDLEPDSSYLPYFLPGGKLEQRVFDIRWEGAGSGLRKGLKLKISVLEYLLCSGRFQDKPYLCWNPGLSGSVWGVLAKIDEPELCLKTVPEEVLSLWMEEKVCRYLEAVEDRKSKSEETTILHLWGAESREQLLYPIWYADRSKQSLGLLDYRRMEEELEAEPSQRVMVLEEAALAEGILCIQNIDDLQGDEKKSRRFSGFLQTAAERLGTIFILSSREKEGWSIPWDAEYIPIEIPSPEGNRRLQLWKALAEDCPVSEGVICQVSGQYEFGIREMEQSLREARRLAYVRGEAEISLSVLHEACGRQLEYSLKEWAVLVENRYGWEDLILPEEQKEALREAVNQIRYRQQVYQEWGFSRLRSYGTGLTLLLTGPPGTGKTMAAQVLAGVLDMELYKIQLPAVVSKYIGETEQNLKHIFQEGRKSRAVLFFDEADVLFSKRTEVKDSHDKYSNMEAAYMLQNMEEYTGVVILATNFPQNIDEAFKRRITFTIEFCLPDYRHRCLLWQQSVPEQLPLEPDVDFHELAEGFELSGSNIKNIMINAAFLAASEQSSVGRRHILKALKGEYGKSGKYFSEDELQL